MPTNELQNLPIVLVGCGAVSQQFYGPALTATASVGHTVVQGLIDPDPNARNILARYFPQAIRASECDAISESIAPRGSLCIVAAPPNFHLPIAKVAFIRGWHVLCEKPMASTSGECVAMIESATRANRLLAIGLYKRFMPAHKALKLLINNQPFGRLSTVMIAEGGKFTWPATSDSFFRKNFTPGGVLLDIGVHVLDLLLWWLGDPVMFDYAHDARSGLEANCVFTGKFQHPNIESEALVDVRMRLSRDWQTPNCYCFRFERATVHCRVNASNALEVTIDGLPMTLAAELRDPIDPRLAPQTRALETNAQAFIAQLIDICLAIRDERKPLVSGNDGAHIIKWIESCYRSAKHLPELWND